MAVPLTSCADPVDGQVPPSAQPGGPLRIVNGTRVLTLTGTPEEMGTQHGQALREDIRWIIDRMIHKTVATDKKGLRDFIRDVKVMEKQLPDPWRRELHALADAA